MYDAFKGRGCNIPTQMMLNSQFYSTSHPAEPVVAQLQTAQQEARYLMLLDTTTLCTDAVLPDAALMLN